MVKFDQRRKFIIAYLRERRNGDFALDVLNQRFSDAYIEATKVKFAPMPYGAHKCPQLGADLARLYREGTFTRRRVGIRELGRGFPSWVYSYTFSEFAQ
jgi:hypothetical protein